MKPNILYLHTHDAGKYIEPYGYGIETPNLMALAMESTLFRKAFASCPTCSPSRASLLTGKYPHNCGMFGLSHAAVGGFSLFDYTDHIAHYLKQEGEYKTYLSGIQHIDGPKVPWENPRIECLNHGSRLPYDEILNRKDLKGPFDCSMTTERAVDFLSKPDKAPFFLSVGYIDPHADFEIVDSLKDADYCELPSPVPDVVEARMDWAGYKKKMRETDQEMGKVIQALKDSGQYDDTIIICTTDHGIGFPGMKCTLKDHGTGVFLIIKMQGQKEGFISDSLVSNVDIFPTLCEAASLDLPEGLDGISLLPILKKEKIKHRSEIFTEINYHAAYEPIRSVRTDRYKYIRRFHDYKKRIIPNTDYSRTKEFLMNSDYYKEQVPLEELYDLYHDPQEFNNIADESLDLLIHFRSKLKTWMIDNKDPLLKGPISMPPNHTIYPQNYKKKDLGEGLIKGEVFNQSLPFVSID